VGGIYTGIIYHLADSVRPSSSGVKAFYSQRKQLVFGFDPTIYTGSFQIGNQTEFLKWPDVFFGLGSDSREEDEESYTAQVIGTDLSVRREWWPHLYAGIRYKFENAKLTEMEEGGVLATDGLPAPVVGTTSGAGITANHDTRDNIFFPTRGHYYGGAATFYGTALGSDFTYNKYTLDIRHYIPLCGTHIAAVQAMGNFMEGQPHFRNYSVIGGENQLRGYNSARYRDRQSTYAQAEYRFPIWKRLRGAVFGGAGDVADAIDDFAPGKFKHAIGGGLRFLAIPKEKIYIRLDFGFGANSDAYYLSVNEAF
jgi:outer membrane protein assembly factor BamA